MGSASSWIGPVLGAAGGFFGSKSTGNQQDVTTTQQVPDWVRNATQWNIDRGQGLANQPYTPYEGQRFAGFNPMQQNAMGSANQFGQMGLGALGGGYNALTDMTGANMMGGAYSGLMGASGLAAMMGMGGNDANAMFGQYSGAGPAQQAAMASRGSIQDVEGGSFLDGSLSDYMNPYTDNVVGDVQNDFNRNWQMQEQQLNSQANAAGAFGGSRHGVQGALSASENQRNFGQLSNRLRGQAYDAATGMMGQDLNRGMQADMANQGMDWNTQNLNANVGMFNAGQGNQMSMFDAGNRNAMSQFNAGLGTQNNQFNAGNRLQGLGMAMDGLGLAGGLGNMMGGFTQSQGRNLTDYGIQGLSSQMNAGNMVQGAEQQQYDFDYQQFLNAQNWYGDRAHFGIDPLQGNYGGSVTQPYFGPSPWQGMMGGAMTGASLQNMFNQGGSRGAFSPAQTGAVVPGSGGQSPQQFYGGFS